jgi:hypothetical protein
LGAGIGGLRETCGAVGAMAYLAGLHIGPYAAGDVSIKAGLYDLIKKMVHEFTLGFEQNLFASAFAVRAGLDETSYSAGFSLRRRPLQLDVAYV